jgi:hypothetical protein
MRALAVAVAVLALAACSKKDEAPAADTSGTTAAVATPAPPPAITLADVEGNWDVNVKNDAVIIVKSYAFAAPADTSKWTMTFTGRKDAMPVHILGMSGDSLWTRVGPYSSAVRKNVQVTTDATYRVSGGKLVGTAVGHYAVKTADSVMTFKLDGTKK